MVKDVFRYTRYLMLWLMLKMLKCFLIAIVLALVLPPTFAFIGAFGNTGGVIEQFWLDDAIAYLKYLRKDCPDPQLCEVLDYTIQRYHKIGPFDVAINQCDILPLDDRILGCNNPLCPGMTLDIDLLHDYGPREGSLTLVHEALHDYPPYIGHDHVYPVLNKLDAWRRIKEKLSPPPRSVIFSRRP